MHIVFETKRLKIRVATPDDAEFYFTLWTHPQVMKFVGFPNGLQIRYEEVVSKLKEPTTAVFVRRLVVELKSTGAKIGECCLHGQDEERIASTDVKLLPQYWGHKYGVEIKQGLVDYLFTHTDCIAVEASPNIENIASIKMQEAVGGVKIREKTYEFPKHMRSYTVPVHSIIYHVYRSDWELKREFHDTL